MMMEMHRMREAWKHVTFYLRVALLRVRPII